MKSVPSFLIKLLIIFILSILFVTFYFIFFFSSSLDSVTLKAVIKIITQFGLIISIPTSIIFVLVDILIEKIKTKWVLYLTRIVVFLCLMYLVSLFFSIYLISNALLDNPLLK